MSGQEFVEIESCLRSLQIFGEELLIINYRAAEIGHRKADAAGAEVIQVGLSDPLADRYPASAFRHPFTVAPAQRGWGSTAGFYRVALNLELHYIW